MKTYDQWIREGRAVRKGETARKYFISPDGQHRRAAFAEDQTEAYVDPAAGWTELVDRDEYRTVRQQRKEAARPKIRIDYAQDTGTLKVWAGPNKKAIEICQKNGYRYEPGSHRWVAQRKQADLIKILEAWESYYGFRVVGDAETTLLRI